MIYVYAGDGAYLVGYPARDLTTAEVEELGLDPAVLLDCGLYLIGDDPPPTGAVAADPEPEGSDA